MSSSFLKLPRAAQRAAFAHMGDEHKGRFSGSLDDPGRGRISGTLGSGSIHGQLTAKRAERQAAGQREIDRLGNAYKRGHTPIQELSGGISADLVQKIQLSDGRQAVLKRQSARDARKEYLAGRVANAVGIKDITVAQVSDRDVVMNFVEGTPGASKMEKATRNVGGYDATKAAFEAETKRQMHLRNGREIGMLDWLVDNNDRHALNWMVSPDGKSVIPIDHGRAGFNARRHGREKQHIAPSSPFSDEWVRPKVKPVDRLRPESGDLFISADPQWTPAELTRIRQELEALRPEFSTGEEPAWFEGMMARFGLLEGT